MKKRTLLGEKQVQGVDYAYTLQGWLKAVNGSSVDPPTELGQDGYGYPPNSVFASDAYSMSLQYFKNDYRSIVPVSDFRIDHEESVSLFNGNIAGMATQTQKSKPLWKSFRYDKLNRIKSMQTAMLDQGFYQWYPLTDAYRTDYIYDFNGNLLSLHRNDLNMSTLHYFSYGYSPYNNRLVNVVFADGSNVPYAYDPIGNLEYDFREQMNIFWNAAGKVRHISTPDISLDFFYSPTGQRQVKQITTAGGIPASQYYIHDATGNVMCVYENTNNTHYLRAIERPIYGSSRLGVNSRVVESWHRIDTQRIIGDRQFELTDHLGNVHAIVSDRKFSFYG